MQALKITSTGAGEGVEALKLELSSLQDQIKQVKDEAAVTQRGLTLKPKSVAETREALRVANTSASGTTSRSRCG